MKKSLFIFSTFTLSLIAISFSPSLSNIVGHWTITYKSGNTTTITFMKDGKFVSEIPAEHFTVGGRYKLDRDVLSISDTSCNEKYWGKYKISFYGKDSIYAVVIVDTCSGRRGAADKVFMVRNK